MKEYIIIVLFVIIFFLWLKKTREIYTNTEAIENITKVYADSFGTMTVNNLESINNIRGNNIDISGNINGNNINGNIIKAENIEISSNLDISGNINLTGQLNLNNSNIKKDYFICTFMGTTNLFETYGTELNLFKATSWRNIYNMFNIDTRVSTRKILYKYKSKSIDIDWINGKVIGLDPEKIYKVEVYINFNQYDIDTAPTIFVARLKNGGTFLNESFAYGYQDKVNFTLSPVIIIKGSDATLLYLSMIRWGAYYMPVSKIVNPNNSGDSLRVPEDDVGKNNEVSITLCITEL